MALKFCANLNFLFTENGNLLEKYRAARKAGFKGVESAFPVGCLLDELLEVQSETSLEHVLMNISTGGDETMKFGCAAFPDGEHQFQKNLDATVDAALTLGCKKIHVQSGACVGTPTEDHLKMYIKNLKFAAKLFESENLLGVIEPINKYAVPGYFLNSYDTAVKVLKEVNSSHLKLMVDIFHLQHIKGDVTHTLKELMPLIGHIQVAQVPHRHEPDEPGELDFGYIFKTIEESGYKGWIGCEYKPKKTTVEGLGWIKKYGYSL